MRATAVAAAVMLSSCAGGGTHHRPPPVPPASPATRWFTAASGPTCASAATVAGLPGVSGAVACRPASGVKAAFSTLPSPAAATAYLERIARSHPGSATTAWKSGGGEGEVVFFQGAGRATVLWTYDAQPYIGWASAGATRTLEAWWDSSGRAVSRP